jgi:hypothetical protein
MNTECGIASCRRWSDFKQQIGRKGELRDIVETNGIDEVVGDIQEAM